MKQKFLIFAAIFMFLASVDVFARDVTTRNVETMDSWQEDFEVIDKKPGKYNVIVTATDKGGNVAYGGPFNIYIDPESDRPVANITNPQQNMRVPGNLNIVGTCIDDDNDGKPKRVWLIFDGDEENKKLAKGTQFWSYYLDTTELSEGPHTIEVYGEDYEVDENKKEAVGKRVKVTWHLDRRQPVTTVTNHGLGELVTGKITLKGTVFDGNGIESLSYSLDGGDEFEPLKLKFDKKQSIWNFEFAVDTKKFPDGPSVIWFKAVDKMGSSSVSSYLYFIDNTKPDVKIISPKADEVCKGIFGVAGYAKDVIGLSKLSWSFNGESGDFELIPGNPYFFKEVDTRKISAKNAVFSVTAVDTLGNTVTSNFNILLNQELDKPKIDIRYPIESEIVDSEPGVFYVGGLASDDDGVASVTYRVDNNEEVTVESHGAFYAPLTDKFLSYGSHKVTAYATDINGIKGNSVTVNFTAKGRAPVFETSVPYGASFHPEDNPHFDIKVNSDTDLANVKYIVSGGENFKLEEDIPLGPETRKLPISIPLTNAPWGIVDIQVVATDSYERTSTYKTLINVKNLTKIETDLPKVVFDDSRVVPNGDYSIIVNDRKNPVTGYFLNSTDVGNIKSVALVPGTSFATVDYKDNVIILKAGNGNGDSSPVKVCVTTDQNKVFESQPIVFRSKLDVEAPVVTLLSVDGNDSPLHYTDISNSTLAVKEAKEAAAKELNAYNEALKAFEEKRNAYEAAVKAAQENGTEEPAAFEETAPVAPVQQPVPEEFVVVTGSVESSASAKVSYKITSLFMNGQSEESEVKSVALNGGRFEIKIPHSEFKDAISVVEVVADNSEKSAEAFFVNNITKKQAVGGKKANVSAPVIKWVEGEDIYYVSLYDGADYVENGIPSSFGRYLRSEIKTGNHTFSASYSYGGKQISSSYTVKAKSDAKVFIRKIGEADYMNGMKVVMPSNSEGLIVKVEVESKIPVKNISFKIDGEKVPGGEVASSGNNIVVSPSDVTENLYTSEFVMPKQPSRLSHITVTASTELGDAVYSGTVAVVREQAKANISDSAKIYWLPSKADFADAQWTLKGSYEFEGFANVYGPLIASVSGAPAGVTVVTGDYVEPEAPAENPMEDAKAPQISGNPRKVTLKFEKDGLYRNISVRVKDAAGNEYVSSPVTILVDNEGPDVKISSPADNQWVRDVLKLSALASDANGIVKSEYSIDDGEKWVPFTANDSVVNISLENAPEGLRTVFVRSFDKAGNVTTKTVGVHRDVTPPEVKVVLPAPEDVINGENLITFIARDNNGFMAKGEYSLKNASGEFKEDVAISPMINTHVGTVTKPLDQNMNFTFYDEAGNATKISEWEFQVDNESDLPVAEIHLPVNNSVITRDFTVSGIVTDDDGKSKIWWKIDDGEYTELPEYDNSFSIDIPLNSLTDNEHSITVYAVDINGVKGHESKCDIRVSLEEPKGEVLTPPISETVRNTITISGTASDKNGIKKVYVSLDNGNSYDEAIGNYSHEETVCNWKYDVDTRVIEDGTHVVFVKIVDWYDVEGLYSSLINVDNTPPVLNLELPFDDSVSTGNIFFSGQTVDNIKLTELFINIRSLDGKRVPAEIAHTDLIPDSIITQVLDISSLEDGFYNIELTGKDAADNITRVSRNLRLDKISPVAKVDLLYPLNGEHVQSVFNIYGIATCAAERKINALKLFADETEIAETALSDSGYYKFTVNNEMMSEGEHKIKVVAILDNGQQIISNEQYLFYNPVGPWITIDNFTYGDFAVERPYIRGKAGYVISDEEKAAAKEKGISKNKAKERADAIAAKSIKSIELSLDNGRTFIELSKKKSDWKYRIENEDIREGFHFLLVRAIMNNGEIAVTRCIVQVDGTKPTVKLISPTLGGKYNQNLEVSGLAHDDVELKSLELALRKGDKSSYEIPGFIQGLYFDGQFWGATLWSAGAGLSFFDDNVKVQFQFGQFTEKQWHLFNDSNFRYGGNVIGLKLLANVFYMPFRHYFGPDWEWLSLNVALGANFSHFSESGSGSDQFLSSLLLQLEFPRITRSRKAKYFRTFSVYTEGQLWFIPSDVSSEDIPTFVPQISVGLRAYVF